LDKDLIKIEFKKKGMQIGRTGIRNLFMNMVLEKEKV